MIDSTSILQTNHLAIKIRIKSSLHCLLYCLELLNYTHTLLYCVLHSILQVRTLPPNLTRLLHLRLALPHRLRWIYRPITLYLPHCVTTLVLSRGKNVLSWGAYCLCLIMRRKFFSGVNWVWIVVRLLVATCILVASINVLVVGTSFLMERSIVVWGWLFGGRVRKRFFFSLIVQYVHELL